MRKIGLVAVLVLSIAMLYLGNARAATVWESGYAPANCDVFGFCAIDSLAGNAGAMSMGVQPVPPSGTTTAYALSLDQWGHDVSGASIHYWMQGGLVMGLAPNGLFYSSPEIYIEYWIDTGYTFTPIGPANFDENHSFKIWNVGLNPCGDIRHLCGYIQVDGVTQASLLVPLLLADGGIPSAFVEVHDQPVAAISGKWSSLQISLSGTSWVSWDTNIQCCGGTSYMQGWITPPYCISAFASNSFSVYNPLITSTGLCYGGGGRGGAKTEVPFGGGGQLIGSDGVRLFQGTSLPMRPTPVLYVVLTPLAVAPFAFYFWRRKSKNRNRRLSPQRIGLRKPASPKDYRPRYPPYQ